MIVIKRGADLEAMRESGGVAARVRDAVAERIAPGVTTGELGDYAAEVMRAHGAESAFLGYRGYPGQICVSVNEEVVHGIPGRRRIRMGDIVSLDVGVRLGGFVGDTATTVMVGVSDPDVMRLVDVTRRALEAGIGAARARGRLSDVSHAVERTAVDAGLSVVREFVGHGIGRSMHEDPQIPNFGPPGRGPRLKPGMTLALEPMVNMGGAEVEIQPDGWTVVTRDGRPSAHFEHTVAVCDGDAEILTQ
ncbi:MAG: type I methionyl aminopeptidase [Lentisphaerae bacterium]|nr:type I methionyl aminopeptidase [Lentisphaerota bacterium]